MQYPPSYHITIITSHKAGHYGGHYDLRIALSRYDPRRPTTLSSLYASIIPLPGTHWSLQGLGALTMHRHIPSLASIATDTNLD